MVPRVKEKRAEFAGQVMCAPFEPAAAQQEGHPAQTWYVSVPVVHVTMYCLPGWTWTGPIGHCILRVPSALRIRRARTIEHKQC